MYEILKYYKYCTDISTMFKNFFVNPLEQENKKNLNAPSYIKEDGTKVYEKDMPFGSFVYEICPDKAFLSRRYDKKGNLLSDYARSKNFEIGRIYDEMQRLVYKFDAVYDENNKLGLKNEYSYLYYDNGAKKTETLKVFPAEIVTVTNFDENGKFKEKYEERGSVKTWFDESGKPIKRQIDRGSGGIIEQDLRNK